MAGEASSAGALSRAFVEIVVPKEAFVAQMAAIRSSYMTTSTAMVGQAQAVSAGIITANKGIAASYAATSLSMKGMMTMMKSALPMLAAYAAITKTLSMARGATDAQREFNKELYQLWTLTDLTQEGIAALGDEIRGLVYNYNVFAAHGTKAMYQIYSATFFAADATEIFESGMRAAAAGVTDVTTAVDMMTTVLNAYNMSASESERVNDLLFTAVRYGKTTYAELAGQFGRLAGVAAPAGARLEEMTAAIATLTRQGIMTDWAVTSLRQTIMQMFRPTGHLADLIRSLGYDTGRSMIQANGFAGALKLVSEGAEKSGIPLENLFTNVRAITAVLPLVTTAAAGFALDLERTGFAAGTMGIAFEKVSQSWEYRIETLKSQINDVAISVGEVLMPSIEDFLRVVSELGEGFGAIAEFMGPFGEFFAALAGYMTGGAVAGGLLAVAIWGVHAAFTALSAHPIIAGIMAVSTVLGVVIGVVKDLTEQTDNAISKLEEYLELRGKLPLPGEEEPVPPAAPSRIEQIDAEIQRLQEQMAGVWDVGWSPEAFQIGILEKERVAEEVKNFLADIGAITGQILTAAKQEMLRTMPTEAEMADLAAMGVDTDKVLDGLRAFAVATAEIRVLQERLADVSDEAAQTIVERYGHALDLVRNFQEKAEEAPPALTDAWKWVDEMLAGISAEAGEFDPTDIVNRLKQVLIVINKLQEGPDIEGPPTVPSAWDWVSKMLEKVEAIGKRLDPANVEGTMVAIAELQDYLGETEDVLDVFTAKGWKGTEMLRELRDRINALLGEDTLPALIREFELLHIVFTESTEGSIAQAESLQGLQSVYQTALGLQEALASVGIKADTQLLKLIADLEALGLAAAKVDITGIAIDMVSQVVGSFLGELGPELAAIITALKPFIGVGFGGPKPSPEAYSAVITSVFSLALGGLGWLFEKWAEDEAEARAAQKAAEDELIDASYALAGAFWDLVQSAESVAMIQEGLAQLQVDIMSTILGFLWPLADILNSITGLFVIQEELITKEVEARQKLLSNLNVPIGWPINRIRFAAATPGEAVEFDWGAVTPEEEEPSEVLTWWQEAMEPFRSEILLAIQPIADFRDTVRAAYEAIFLSIMEGILPVLDTFGWTLGQLSTWIETVLVDDLSAFAEGFGTFWTDLVDPFWREDMAPQVGEWLDRIYGWLDAIIGFFSTEGWDWLSTDVWGAIQPFVDSVLDMFEEFGTWVGQNWPTIKEVLLDRIQDVLRNLGVDLDEFLQKVKDWLLGGEWDPGGEPSWFSRLISAVLDLPNRISNFFDDVGTILDTISGGLDIIKVVLIAGLGALIGAIIGGAGFWSPAAFLGALAGFIFYSAGQVHQLAEGGIAMRPTLSLIGEQPEVVLPLDRLAGLLSTQPMVSAAGLGGINPFSPSAQFATAGAGGHGATININLSQQRLTSIMLKELRSKNVNDSGVGFAPIRM